MSGMSQEELDRRLARADEQLRKLRRSARELQAMGAQLKAERKHRKEAGDRDRPG